MLQEIYHISGHFLLPVENSSRKAFLTLYLPFCITQPLGSVLPSEATELHKDAGHWAPWLALRLASRVMEVPEMAWLEDRC